MAFRNFFRFGDRHGRPYPKNDFTPKDKEHLFKVRNAIFNSLNGQPATLEQQRDTSALSDVPDIGGSADFSQMASSFSNYIYSQERNKRLRVEIYREMSKYPPLAFAVDEYVDEAINEDKEGNVVSLRIKNNELRENDNQRKTLLAEFDHVVHNVMKLHKYIDFWFREFMIDAEVFFEKIIDNSDETKGVIGLKKLMTTRVTPIYQNLESDDIMFYAYMTEDGGLLNLSTEMIAYANSGHFAWTRDESEKVPLSFLESAKITYKRLKLLEDALVIYRVVRAPERRVFKIDVGNLPKGRADQFLQDMIRKYRQRKFFNTATGEIEESVDAMAMTEDFWFPVFQGGRSSDVQSLPGGCLALDTKIPLLDGRTITLGGIIDEHKSGIQNWVYSCDPVSGEIKPGKIDNAGITKRNAQLMKITFDNGKSVRCTPEHKFPVVGQGMTEAKDLSVNDSIWKNGRSDGLDSHKIVSIEYLTETEDVGDLQIDNKHIIHNYHTYAIDAGVFVSNSGLGETGDLDYFKTQLYSGLKIPRSRWGEENRFSIGDATGEITREEDKFHKEVKRYVRRFSEIVLSVFMTHLKLKGIADEYGIEENDIAIEFFSNNLFERFMEAKIIELQFQNFNNFSDLINTEKPLFSRKWVVQKYLEVSEEDWQENVEMLVAEEDESENTDDEDTEEDLGF